MNSIPTVQVRLILKWILYTILFEKTIAKVLPVWPLFKVRVDPQILL